MLCLANYEPFALSTSVVSYVLGIPTDTCCGYPKKIIALAIGIIATIGALIADLFLSAAKTMTAGCVEEPKRLINPDLLSLWNDWPLETHPYNKSNEHAVEMHLKILDAKEQKLFLTNMMAKDATTLKWCALNLVLVLLIHSPLTLNQKDILICAHFLGIPNETRRVIFEYLHNPALDPNQLPPEEKSVFQLLERLIAEFMDDLWFCTHCEEVAEKFLRRTEFQS